jgi:hypothetical protein
LHQTINHIPSKIIDRLLETLIVAPLSSKHSAFHGTGIFVPMFKRSNVDTKNFHRYICKGPSIIIKGHGVVTTSARYMEDPWFICHGVVTTSARYLEDPWFSCHGVVTTSARNLEDPWFSCHPRGKLSSAVS